MADPKSNKLKARLPRGLFDRAGAEIAATRRMMETIRQVYERYGFEPLETPAIEYTDALGKFLPDQDRPNEGVFSFQDDDEQWLSLRYDLTAPLARYVAENFDQLPKPYRSYRAGFVFRNEKPGPGRFRQFMQFDADTVGSASMAADAENCMMAADLMEALGVPRGSYVVKVNNRKVLDGVLEAIGLGGEENAGKRLIVLRALDKYDRLGIDGVRQLLAQGRKDESGDFTKGAELDDEQIRRLVWFLTLRTNPHGISSETLSAFNPNITVMPENGEPYETNLLAAMDKAYGSSAIFHEGVQDLTAIEDILMSAGYNDGRVIIDPSVVRGLEYYTGPVYEADLTLETVDEKGQPVRFGSVASGGRYDGLVARFRGEPVPATGISIGVSRLLAALTHLRKVEKRGEIGPVVVTVFSDRDPAIARRNLRDAQRLAQTLRRAGIRAEAYFGNPKNIPNQFKYADRRGSPCVVIQGSDEKQKGEVQIKDLIVGAELAGLSQERDDYLKKQAEAQFAVKEEQLVARVRQLLNSHGLIGEDASPDDDDHQIMETFARFGRAIYMANVVELGLAQTLLQIQFLTPARETFIKEQGKNFDRKKFDIEFDAFMKEQSTKMMGQLKQQVSQHAEFDEALRKRIEVATSRRNFLAHHYWRESGEKLMTKDGRAEMINELSMDADRFEQLDKDIRQATKPVREKLGINEDALNRSVEKRLGELKEELKLK